MRYRGPIPTGPSVTRTDADGRPAAGLPWPVAHRLLVPPTLPDGGPRCGWAGATPELRHYHDTEWGFPVASEHRLFEKICLEGFQSGLSWRTILAKRENFRRAFAGFDPHAVAAFGEADVVRLLADAGIVRHRGKIEAAINNARRVVALEAEGGSLSALVWGFEPAPDDVDPPGTVSTSPASVALSRELKRRGWRFVGPTTAFAFMQAMGLVNDHVDGCVVRPLVAAERRAFTPPR